HRVARGRAPRCPPRRSREPARARAHRPSPPPASLPATLERASRPCAPPADHDRARAMLRARATPIWARRVVLGGPRAALGISFETNRLKRKPANPRLGEARVALRRRRAAR